MGRVHDAVAAGKHRTFACRNLSATYLVERQRHVYGGVSGGREGKGTHIVGGMHPRKVDGGCVWQQHRGVGGGHNGHGLGFVDANITIFAHSCLILPRFFCTSPNEKDKRYES